MRDRLQEGQDALLTFAALADGLCLKHHSDQPQLGNCSLEEGP